MATNNVVNLGTNAGSMVVGSTGGPVYSTSFAYDFTFTTAAIGSISTLTKSNPDNTNAGSHSVFQVTSGGTSGGFPVLRTAVGTSRSYAIGVNTPSSLDWKLTTDNSGLALPNSTTLMNITPAGSVTKPLNPCASVYLNSTLSNATGDGTYVNPIIFDTKLTDQQSNYNISTGLFTCPVTGIYLVTYYITYVGLTALHTGGSVNLVSNGSTSLYRSAFNPSLVNDGGGFTYGMSVCTPCTSGQTLSIASSIGGSTKTVSILGYTSGIYTSASFTLIT